MVAAEQCSAESRAARLPACCHSGEAPLLPPGALVILILPLYDEQEMRKQSWEEKNSRR